MSRLPWPWLILIRLLSFWILFESYPIFRSQMPRITKPELLFLFSLSLLTLDCDAFHLKEEQSEPPNFMKVSGAFFIDLYFCSDQSIKCLFQEYMTRGMFTCTTEYLNTIQELQKLIKVRKPIIYEIFGFIKPRKMRMFFKLCCGYADVRCARIHDENDALLINLLDSLSSFDKKEGETTPSSLPSSLISSTLSIALP